MVNNLVLVEGSKDVELLKSTLVNSDIKIISFDFEADKLLNEYGINHSIVEEYLTKEDESEMDNEAVVLTTKWYLHNEIKNKLEYNQMNIGSLLEIELIGYFFEYIKRMLGILRVIEKELPEIIITSFLTECAESICKGKKIKIIKYKSEKKILLFFDSIEIPINFNEKIYTIKLSRKRFLQFKKVINKIINFLYKIKPDLNKMKNEKAILLLDYNPILYEELLEELSKSKHKILLLNQRRPAIWNFESLKIIKNSKCKIIELNDFGNEEIKLKIEEEKEDLENKLKKLWGEKIFYEIFSIRGYSFWDAINDDFSSTITKRFTESIERFHLTNQLFDELNICSILEWAHVGMEDKIIISNANKRKIPNMFLQHGLILQNSEIDKYNPILSIFPSNGSKHAVWGKIVEEFLLQHDVEKNEINKIGSPRHDKFFKKRKDPNSEKILIATNGFFAPNSSGTNSKNFKKMEDGIKEIFKVLKNTTDREIIVKLHPGIAQKSYDVKKIIREIDPNVKIFQNKNILDLLEESYAMISLNYSTVILDAFVTKTPSMVFLPEDQGFKNEIPIKNEIVLNTSDIKQIKKMVIELLHDENIRNDLVSKGDEFVKEYFINRGTACKEIRKILES